MEEKERITNSETSFEQRGLNVGNIEDNVNRIEQLARLESAYSAYSHIEEFIDKGATDKAIWGMCRNMKRYIEKQFELLDTSKGA